MSFPWPWGQHFLSCGSATLLVNVRGWYYLSSPWPKWVLDSETDFVQTVECALTAEAWNQWPATTFCGPGHIRPLDVHREKSHSVYGTCHCELSRQACEIRTVCHSKLRETTRPQQEVIDPSLKLRPRKSTHWPGENQDFNVYKYSLL